VTAGRDARTGLQAPLGCFSTAVGSRPSVDLEHARVTAAEVTELLRFERRLRHRGQDATCAEWVAYFEAKADLLDRVAYDPETFADPAEARRSACIARDEAERLRVEAADWRWL
jgi:hypothetical protein